MPSHVHKHAPAPSSDEDRPTWRFDVLLALFLAFVLQTAWAAQDWANLSHLILPDADDMMRLAQVRDWLAGQGTNDWTQYRMAPPLGSPMHWSRVNDAGLAAIILALTPTLGHHNAEIVAVLAYPGGLFALHLLMCARIGKAMWGRDAALAAMVLGALAYPGTTIFAPGRTDHHALQVVLIEIAVLAVIGRSTLASGLIAGSAIALSLVIGLETALQLASVLAVGVVAWIVRGPFAGSRLLGVAVGLVAITAPFVLFLRPTLWAATWCDAFTPASSNATFAAAAALSGLALGTTALRTRKGRFVSAAVLGTAVLAMILIAYPSCLVGPYGQVSPLLRREFIAHINEANGVFREASIGRMMQLGGLMLVGLLGVAWAAICYPLRWRRWAPVAAIVVVSSVLTVVQVRGTYVGAPLTAPLLAGVLLSVRRRTPAQPLLLAGTWLACSGMGWYGLPAAAKVILSSSGRGSQSSSLNPLPPRSFCNTANGWQSVDRYPPGVVMAPTTIAAYLVGATRMSTVGAGYHRNDRGNMAMYRFFLSPPERAAEIGRAWGVRYVLFCPGDFTEMDVARRYPHSLATMLNAGQAPPWFEELGLRGTRMRLYRLP